MSIQPAPIDPVPDQTRRVARAAFPKGNPYLTLRDQLGAIFQDHHFADLYPDTGQPGLSPWRLAWVTILQFRESLSDRQAAEAVRARIDWKYLLGLDLTDCGFDFSVLSEFRSRLLEGSAPARLLDRLLACCQAQGGVAPFRWTVDSLAFKPLVDCSSRSLVVTGSRGQSDGGVGCTSLLYIQRSPCGPQPGYGIRGDQ